MRFSIIYCFGICNFQQMPIARNLPLKFAFDAAYYGAEHAVSRVFTSKTSHRVEILCCFTPTISLRLTTQRGEIENH